MLVKSSSRVKMFSTSLALRPMSFRAFCSALYAGCAAPAAANEIERGSGIQERVTRRLDAIHSWNRVENDLALGDVSFRNQAIQFDRAEFLERTLVGPVDGGIVNDISIRS
jgi:hypothetical protein